MKINALPLQDAAHDSRSLDNNKEPTASFTNALVAQEKALASKPKNAEQNALNSSVKTQRTSESHENASERLSVESRSTDNAPQEVEQRPQESLQNNQPSQEPLTQDALLFKRKLQRQLESLGLFIGDKLKQTLSGQLKGSIDAADSGKYLLLSSSFLFSPQATLSLSQNAHQNAHQNATLKLKDAVTSLNLAQQVAPQVAIEDPAFSSEISDPFGQAILLPAIGSLSTATPLPQSPEDPLKDEQSAQQALFPAVTTLSNNTLLVGGTKEHQTISVPLIPQESNTAPSIFSKSLKGNPAENSSESANSKGDEPPQLEPIEALPSTLNTEKPGNSAFGLATAQSKGAAPQSTLLRQETPQPLMGLEFSSQLTGMLETLNTQGVQGTTTVSSAEFIEALKTLQDQHQARLSLRELQNSGTSVTLDLQLPTLGKTSLQVSWNAIEGSAKIHFETQSSKELALIEGALEHLAQTLENSGIVVEQISASERMEQNTQNAGSGFSFEQNPQHQREHFLTKHTDALFSLDEELSVATEVEPQDNNLALIPSGFEMRI